MKKIVLTTIMMISLIGLAGCQIGENEKNYERTVTITQTVTHATSRTDAEAKRATVDEVVPVNPKNLAIFDFGALDIIDTIGLEKLGIEKLAVVKSNMPQYLSKYNNNSVTNAGTLFEPDFDALDLFDADLVIISSRSAWAYDRLKSELGGVAVLNLQIDNQKYLESVVKNLNNLKLVFDNLADFDQLITTLESETNALKTSALASNLNALILMTNGDDISGYGIGSRFSFIHNELGFTAADSNFGNGDTNTHGDTVSFEYVQTLNPNIIFVVDRSLATGGEPSIGVLNNSLVNSTSAAQNDRIIILDAIAWYIVSGGYQSTLRMINDVKVLFS